MAFENTIKQSEAEFQALVLAAKGYLQNIIDLAASSSTIQVQAATEDTIAFIKGAIPASATAAQSFFDEIAKGVEKPAEEFLNNEIAHGFLYARQILAKLIPDSQAAVVKNLAVSAAAFTPESVPHGNVSPSTGTASDQPTTFETSIPTAQGAEESHLPPVEETRDIPPHG